MEPLRAFLVTAKRSTYAAQGDEASVRPLLAGSKQLEFRQGPYAYRDIYFGMTRFVGQETVTHEDRVVWSMAYAGGLSSGIAPAEARAIYAALREALLHPNPDLPIRGPTQLSVAPFTYTCVVDGDVAAFHGVETLERAGQQVYSLSFSGGLIA